MFSQPIILLAIFCALKLRNKRLWVRLGKVNTDLDEVTSNFERNSGIALTAADDSRNMVMRSNELLIHRARGGLRSGQEIANDV